MKEYYLKWREQALRGLEAGRKTRSIDPGRGAVLFCGMGGSGIIGDLIATLAYDRLNRPFLVVKDREPPAWVSPETLVIAVSYSGNTAETLECVEKAFRKTQRMVLVSSGGRMLELSRNEDLPLVTISRGMPPRAAMAEMLYAVLGYFSKLDLSPVSPDEIEESLTVLSMEPPIETTARMLAEAMLERLPIIASTRPLHPLALRWKNELNENAKIPVKVEILPEWGHNDVVGWEKPVEARYMFLVLDNGRDRALLDFASEWYERIGPVARIELKGRSLLSQLMHGALLGGLASIELASLRGVDPMKTRGIELYKQAYSSLHR